MEQIIYDDFAKIQLKVGTIREAERVEGSEKLLKLQVDLGEESLRQILAGIGKAYEPESLIEKQIIVVANLAPRMMMGFESQGMLLAAGSDEGPVIVSPSQVVGVGSDVH